MKYLILTLALVSSAFAQPPATASGNAGILKQATGDVTLWGAVPNDGLDDRIAVQAAIDAGDLITFPPGQWDFAGPLVLDDNQTIRALPGSVMKRKDASIVVGQPILLVNEDPVNGNENISIIGGKWDFNGHENTRTDTAWQPQTGFRFKRVHNILVRDCILKDPVRFSTLFTLCTEGLIENIHFDQEIRMNNGDGIHCNGCIGMTVQTLRGNCGDDMCNFATGDSEFWQDGEDGRGPNLYNTVRDVYAEAGSSAVRVLSFDNDRADGILIEDIRGSFDGIVIFASGRVALPNPNYGRITIRNVSAIRTNALQTTGFPVIGTDAAIEYLDISDISRVGDTTTNPIFALFNENDGNSFGEIHLSNIYDHSSVDRSSFIINAPFKKITLNNCTKIQTAGTKGGSLFQFLNNFDGDLDISNITTEGDGLTFAPSAGTTTNIKASNIEVKNGTGFLNMEGGSTATIELTNAKFDGLTFAPLRVVDSRLTTALVSNTTVTNIASGQGLAVYAGTGTGTHRLMTSNVIAPNDPAFFVINTNSVSYSGIDFAVTGSALTPLNGDMWRDAAGDIFIRASGTTLKLTTEAP